MTITLRKTPDSLTETLEVDNVRTFVADFPLAVVEVNGRWVAFEKVYPITGFEAP